MMIRKSAGNSNSQSTRRKIDQLYTCLRYCEDTFECRRTLQLQFFGEKFDSKKCTGCDNCRAGNVVDKRNMTPVAREILGLLSSLEAQKNGRGVTLLALSELWRGTKAKSHTKFLNIDGLTGYGNGSKYSKQDIDTITHAMVFETVLEEIAEATVSGFAADYIRPGPKSQVLLAGSFQGRRRTRWVNRTTSKIMTTKQTRSRKPYEKARSQKGLRSPWICYVPAPNLNRLLMEKLEPNGQATKQRFPKSTPMPFSRGLRNLSICGLKRFVRVFNLFDCKPIVLAHCLCTSPHAPFTI